MTQSLRLTTDFLFPPRAAIALTRGAAGLHTGLLYRAADEVRRVMHLAMHFRLRTDACEGWAYAHPGIDDIDLASLAGFCAVLDARRPKLPYGLRLGTSSFDDSGRFVAGPNEIGLTCATFIVAIFEWAKVPLIDISTWQSRADDGQAQRALVEVLRGSREATPEHIAAVEREIGCVRVRPEEVAASSTSPARPVDFVAAARIGVDVLTEFRALGL